MKQSRALTHDEKRASEAAFQGFPMDDSWSSSAKAVYKGLIEALNSTPPNLPLGADKKIESMEEPRSQTSEGVVPSEIAPAGNPMESSEEYQSIPIRSRKEAIESGILKDLTPIAQDVGLDFCVGMTNPLWDQYINSSPDFTTELIQTRLRDTLVAVRLRLASLKNPTPLVDVPVLLQFPPESIPQLCLTFALFHKDSIDGDCLLLIHPGEVFATRQSFENN